jgi:hypothetical protein
LSKIVDIKTRHRATQSNKARRTEARTKSQNDDGDLARKATPLMTKCRA